MDSLLAVSINPWPFPSIAFVCQRVLHTFPASDVNRAIVTKFPGTFPTPESSDSYSVILVFPGCEVHLYLRVMRSVAEVNSFMPGAVHLSLGLFVLVRSCCFVIIVSAVNLGILYHRLSFLST